MARHLNSTCNPLNSLFLSSLRSSHFLLHTSNIQLDSPVATSTIFSYLPPLSASSLFCPDSDFAQLELMEMEIEYSEEFIKNSRGVQLFTCKWLPAVTSPKALIFICHGYGMECSSFMRGCGTRLACSGYAVIGIDYEGHGRSGGARCYIKKFDNIVNDCDSFFKFVCGQEEYKKKKRYLYGESMGGAVALLLHKKNPKFWNGAVLVAPMCKISEKVKPHPVVVNLLTRIEDVIPKWKIVPTRDVIDSAFKDPLKRDEIRSNKMIYQDKPRLKTALEMLRTSMSLEDSLDEVTLPFFVLHGEADIVTDPEISRALYEQASSLDKTIKLYSGMWHGLTYGEPEENVEMVFSDIVAWLDKRVSGNQYSIYTCLADPTYSGDKLITMTPTSAAMEKQKRQRMRLNGSKYLCGWKGKKMQYHSAM